MRVLANENVSSTVVHALRAQGHDVVAVKEWLPGVDDEAVLRRAQAERRVVLTHDKGFGELAYGRRLPATCGIVLLRLSGANRDADNLRALSALTSRTDWEGHFSVVTDEGTRMRPLPPCGEEAVGD
jgi:predicted nuclease of predicted toxin-antitoxin system